MSKIKSIPVTKTELEGVVGKAFWYGATWAANSMMGFIPPTKEEMEEAIEETNKSCLSSLIGRGNYL